MDVFFTTSRCSILHHKININIVNCVFRLFLVKNPSYVKKTVQVSDLSIHWGLLIEEMRSVSYGDSCLQGFTLGTLRLLSHQAFINELY